MPDWLKDAHGYIHWFDAWRHDVRMAHNLPAQREGYSNAAVLAQAQYVIHRALWLGKYGVNQK